MDLQLKDKVAIVLAASKGLGRASALALSAEGAKVVISSRNTAELSKTAAEIQQQTGNQVLAIPADVSVAEQVNALIKKTANTFGRIDILLNNGGGPPFDKFETFFAIFLYINTGILFQNSCLFECFRPCLTTSQKCFQKSVMSTK